MKLRTRVTYTSRYLSEMFNTETSARGDMENRTVYKAEFGKNNGRNKGWFSNA